VEPVALNRALLARQGLLERQTWSPAELCRRLLGLQHQETDHPYVGAWSRLASVDAPSMAAALRDGELVRAPAWRSTLHLLDAADHREHWPAVQQALERGMRSFFGKDLRDHDVDAIAAAAGELLAEGPQQMKAIRQRLGARFPDGPRVEALSYVLRTRLPVRQLPPGGLWRRGGSAPYALVDGVAADADWPTLLRRYLAAFGPATVRDAQAFFGVTGLKDAWAQLELEDVGGGLADLPGAPRPGPYVDPPVRLVARYDNLVLGHADRTRIVPEEHRKGVFLSAGRVRETFLVDGFVAGTWSVQRPTADTVRVTLEPFGRLARERRRALEDEAAALEAFLAAPPA
jgi:hypothetical protein